MNFTLTVCGAVNRLLFQGSSTTANFCHANGGTSFFVKNANIMEMHVFFFDYLGCLCDDRGLFHRLDERKKMKAKRF